MALIDVRVPDIGDYQNIPVIELLVKVGDTVSLEQGLITLESDKATMEVPSPQAGKVVALAVKLGDKVSQGSLVLSLEASAKDSSPVVSAPVAQAPAPKTSPAPTPVAVVPAGGYDFDVVVIGAGPGGYTAAFRAADLGLKVALIEKHATLGGVCLNVGCIPSKTLLHVAGVVNEARDAHHHGVNFGAPKLDIKGIRGFKEGVVNKLTKGLEGLAKQRKVTTYRGTANFASDHSLSIDTVDGNQTVSFAHAIIAVGSHATKIPSFPDDPRLMDSTGALALEDFPESLLVIGGGIIGLEMATVYAAFGSQVTVVELMDGLMPGADRDLVKPMQKRLEAMGVKVLTSVKVANVQASKKGLTVEFARDGGEAPPTQTFSRALLSVGRRPNGRAIAAEKAGVQVDERGFIRVDRQMRTNVPHIFAIGDVVGDPMLAHKATHEAKVAAEVIAGHKAAFEPACIPSVAYTDPEIAWVGLTETQAKKEGIAYEKAVFPWMASGRALAMGREEGSTKLLYCPSTHRILGGGIVGKSAGDLIGEVCLAVEFAADINDVALTIHPHLPPFAKPSALPLKLPTAPLPT
jgi:dihydrolipoamide dehydrogenase